MLDIWLVIYFAGTGVVVSGVFHGAFSGLYDFFKYRLRYFNFLQEMTS